MPNLTLPQSFSSSWSPPVLPAIIIVVVVVVVVVVVCSVRTIAALTALLAASSGVLAQEGCTGTPNTYPIYTGNPVFVKSLAGGSRWSVGPANINPQLNILHLQGTAYQMGYQYGLLMHDEINALVPETLDYLYSQIDQYLAFLPKAVREAIEQFGIEAGLNLTVMATAPYTPQHFTDLIAGMANGTGLDVGTLTRINMIPELIKAGCSMFGAWDQATINGSGGLLQLRALDWDTDGPFQQFPVLINYHPANGTGYDFTTMTWSGLVGAITGYSSSGMAVSEKVWLSYTGIENIVGYPFHYVLSDILQFDMDTDAALSRIASANRTCSIFIGIGDEYNNEFKVVEYGWEDVNIYNDRNFPIYNNHDRFESLVFVDKHVQPSENPCLNSLLHEYYGSLDAATTIKIVSLFQTGDMHIAIYDFNAKAMYVANASPPNTNGTISPAYQQPFIRLDMHQMWNASLANYHP